MLSLLGLVLIPLLFGGGAAIVFRQRITLKEFFLLEAIALTVALGGWAIARWGAMQDTEYWNGRISNKTHGSQKCCHCRQVCNSYSKDSNGNTTCDSYREECDHFQDYWWNLEVSTGDTISVENCEPFRDRVPSIWTAAYIGEPASVAHSYTNYLKADPDSLMHRSVVKTEYLEKIPENSVPRIYDLYHSSKVFQEGPLLPGEWDKLLRELNADISGPFQIDLRLYVTSIKDPAYADSIEAKWLYGPKNSLTIVAGTDGKVFTWIRVVTLSRVEELKILMRDKLTGWEISNPVGGVKEIRQIVTGKFRRTPMKEWEYLASAASPSNTVLVILYILTTMITLGGLYVMYNQDVFGPHNSRYRY
jgi:hypothetical protein